LNIVNEQRKFASTAEVLAISLSPLLWPTLAVLLEVFFGGYLKASGHVPKFIFAIVPFYFLGSYLSAIPVAIVCLWLRRLSPRTFTATPVLNTTIYGFLVGAFAMCISILNGSAIATFATAFVVFAFVGAVISLPTSLTLYFARRAGPLSQVTR
jgi:hypothetical protein